VSYYEAIAFFLCLVYSYFHNNVLMCPHKAHKETKHTMSTLTPEAPVAPQPSQPEDQTTPNRWSLKKRGLIALGAGLAIVASAAGGIAAANQAPAPAPVAEAPADPVAEAPVDGTDTPEQPVSPESLVIVDELPENVVEHGMFELLSPEQQAFMRELDSMSYEEVRTLPETDQLKFAEFVFRNNYPILKYRLEQTGQAGILDQANLDTPEGIQASYQTTFGLISSLKEFNNGITYDANTAKKLVVMLNAYGDTTGINRQNEMDNRIDQVDINMPVAIIDGVVEASRIEQNGVIIISTVNIEGTMHAQQTYEKISFTSIDDKQIELARTILAVNDSDPRYIPLN
jgi:hypothetical protein